MNYYKVSIPLKIIKFSIEMNHNNLKSIVSIINFISKIKLHLGFRPKPTTGGIYFYFENRLSPSKTTGPTMQRWLQWRWICTLMWLKSCIMMFVSTVFIGIVANKNTYFAVSLYSGESQTIILTIEVNANFAHGNLNNQILRAYKAKRRCLAFSIPAILW